VAGNPRISIIVAMAKNRVIGANGTIPWHLPEELKRFKTLTMGHHIIMGRKTWESIGRLLPGRETVIVTRQPGYSVPGAKVAHSLSDAIIASGDDKEIFVIGGAELFRESLTLADRMYLTIVDTVVAGDTYMPEFDAGSWREVSSDPVAADAKNRHAFTLRTYDRIAR
jgi:dihydrofolate reductase